MIKEYYDLVKKILEETPIARDNDCFIVSTIWHYELKSIDDKQTMLSMLARGDLSNYESIGRCRRKIQELHPELRGTKWKERHELEEEVKAEVKQMESSFHKRFGTKETEKKEGDLFRE